MWYIGRKWHHEDGPAVENASGTKSGGFMVWITLKPNLLRSYLRRVLRIPQDSTENLNGKIATIDGRQYVFIVMCH